MKARSFIFVAVSMLTLGLTIPFETMKANPPRWAPAHGYRAKTHHIYFPEQNFYYDTRRAVYIYPENGRWVTSVQLPGIFASINLFAAPKVELVTNSYYPNLYNRRHIEMYRERNRRDYYDKERKHDRRDYYREGRDRDRDGDRDRDRDHGKNHKHEHDRDDD